MDELIHEAMVCAKQLAVMAKSTAFNPQQAEILKQSVYNGQIIVQGLHTVQSELSRGSVNAEYEFLAVYFREQAESYLRRTKNFIDKLDAING